MKLFYIVLSAFDAAASFVCYQRGEVGWGLIFSICAGLMFAAAGLHKETPSDEA